MYFILYVDYTELNTNIFLSFFFDVKESTYGEY